MAHRLSSLAALAAVLAACLGGCSSGEDDDAEPADIAEEAYTSGRANALSPDEWREIRERCAPPEEGEPGLGYGDYTWGYSLEEMGARFEALYVSPKRLPHRAFYDEASSSLVMPITAAWGGRVTLPPRLVKSVARHIESALARGYVDFVFFPDMGHSHFFVPEDHWQAVYAGYPVPRLGEMYTKLLDDPKLKILYHTAEQLTVRDADGNLSTDRKLAWRFFTRNIVGDNRAQGILELLHEPGSAANTAHDYPGHKYYGGGFYVSAHEKGCFRYSHQGRTVFFDLSLAGLGS
jgi:hypothetical protein